MQSSEKNNDIKKNPSRDYEQGKGSTMGRNEINPGKMGNEKEVDLDRSGVQNFGGNKATDSSKTGYNAPTANQNQKQQAQKQQPGQAGQLRQGTDANGGKNFGKSQGQTAGNVADEDLDDSEVSFDSEAQTGTARPNQAGQQSRNMNVPQNDRSANI